MNTRFKIIVLLFLLQGCTPDYDTLQKNLVGSWYSQIAQNGIAAEYCTTYAGDEGQSLRFYQFKSEIATSVSGNDHAEDGVTKDAEKKIVGQAKSEKDSYVMSQGHWYFGRGKRLQHIAGFKTTFDNRVIPEGGTMLRDYRRFIVETVDSERLEFYKEEIEASSKEASKLGDEDSAFKFKRVDNCDRFASVIESLPRVEKDFAKKNYSNYSSELR